MSDVVELDIPVDADLIVLVRLAASACAARASFGVEEIEDLRLAVEELCLPHVRGGEGRLHLCYTCGGDAVEISCTLVPGAGPTAAAAAPDDEIEAADHLSSRILDALVDEHGRDVEDGRNRSWLRKRRSEIGVE